MQAEANELRRNDIIGHYQPGGSSTRPGPLELPHLQILNDDIQSDQTHARDHLANERTYLAWMRTGVATMGLGVVIAKLKYIFGAAYAPSSGIVHAANIGLLFAAIGMITIPISALFFLRTRNEIRNGTYRSRQGFVLLLTALMLILGLVILLYLMQPMARSG